MTKTVKLTQYYMDTIFNGSLMKGKKIHGKYHFFNYTSPPRAEGEGCKSEDVANDPTNVPIYDQIEGSPTYGKIIRYEGTAENPIECYGCNCDEELTMPTDVADTWIASNIFEEVV